MKKEQVLSKEEVRELELFYCEASANGWAGGKRAKNLIPLVPGLKYYKYSRANKTYFDIFVNTKTTCFGLTILFMGLRLVWGMVYVLKNSYDAIQKFESHVKKARLAAYQAGEFNVGWGVKILDDEQNGVYYRAGSIQQSRSNNFRHFEGFENGYFKGDGFNCWNGHALGGLMVEAEE